MNCKVINNLTDGQKKYQENKTRRKQENTTKNKKLKNSGFKLNFTNVF